MILGRLLSSPIVHFFAAGAVIFAVFAVLQDDPQDPESDAISLSPEAARVLADRFAATWSRMPEPDELEQLMQAWALEEVRVREALALGLDQGDALIRQRLNLKMQFLAESGAAVLEPDDNELQSFLDNDTERFLNPARIAFDQILLSEDGQTHVPEILLLLNGGADAADLGETTLLPSSLPLTPAPNVDRIFGEGFGGALAGLPSGAWQGPVKSAYGAHLVRVTDRTDAIVPALSEIRQRVEAEWRAAKAREQQEAFDEAMLARYSVDLPSVAEVLAE